MLIIRRRVGERIVVGAGIEITVAEVGKGGVRLAVSAPRGITVLRGEVHDAVVRANEEAAKAAQAAATGDDAEAAKAAASGEDEGG